MRKMKRETKEGFEGSESSRGCEEEGKGICDVGEG